MFKNFPAFFSIVLTVLVIVLAYISNTLPVKVSRIEILKSLNGTARISDQQIKISFSRPMDKESVEKSFSIIPKVKGNLNWVGNTIFFTATEPLIYNTEYKINIPSRARDIYSRTLTDFTHILKTPAYKILYVGSDDQLYIADVFGDKQKLTTDKNIKEYAFSAESGRVVYIHKKPDTQNAKVYFINLDSAAETELFAETEADFQHINLTAAGDRLYIHAAIKDPKSYEIVNRIYEYSFKDKTKKELSEILKTHPTLVKFWLLPDGNTFLLNDYEANFYLRPINENKSTLIGKYTDFYGGSSSKGDKLMFGETNPDKNWQPFLKIYDGKSHKIVEELGSTIFYEISQDGKRVVYSNLPQEDEGTVTEKRLGIKVIRLEDNFTEASHIEDAFSYERGKLSPDNKILAVEVYKREGHFLDIFGTAANKEFPSIRFLDMATGKFINTQFDGKKMQWIQ